MTTTISAWKTNAARQSIQVAGEYLRGPGPEGCSSCQLRVVAVGVEDGIAGTDRHVAVRGEVRKKLQVHFVRHISELLPLTLHTK